MRDITYVLLPQAAHSCRQSRSFSGELPSGFDSAVHLKQVLRAQKKKLRLVVVGQVVAGEVRASNF